MSHDSHSVLGPDRKQLLVFKNVRAIKAYLGSIGSYLKGEVDSPMVSFIQPIRRLYINPLRAVAYDNLGSLLARIGGIEDALSAYRKAIRIDRDLALPFARTGDIEKAIDTVGKLLERDPADRRARELHQQLHELKKTLR